MTLRELVQQAGGINSPQMDYKLEINNFSNLDDEDNHISGIEIFKSSKIIRININGEEEL